MKESQNTWTFSGELFYIREQEGEFAASLKIRGISRRKNASSSQIAEITCLAEKELYGQFVHKKIDLYKKVIVSGHIETWQRVKDTGKIQVRTMFIADAITLDGVS